MTKGGRLPPPVRTCERWDILTFQASHLARRLQTERVITDDVIESPLRKRVMERAQSIFGNGAVQIDPLEMFHNRSVLTLGAVE